ncbi:MAG: 4a-hydroxytetrahydrobiopterin dehydratase [Myxococcota bacterium]
MYGRALRKTPPSAEESSQLQSQGWSASERGFEKEWRFKTEAEAMEFIANAARTADSYCHHPDIEISGHLKRVRVSLTSRDAQGQATFRDARVARAIEDSTR